MSIMIDVISACCFNVKKCNKMRQKLLTYLKKFVSFSAEKLLRSPTFERMKEGSQIESENFSPKQLSMASESKIRADAFFFVFAEKEVVLSN